MPKPKKVKPYATEADLCAAFIATIGDDWTAYAETAGWDILLVRKADGFQIGIEAKLRLNTDVINQAIEEYGYTSADRPGPDCRAVLVPFGDAGGFHRIAKYIGFTIISMSVGFAGQRYRSRPEFEPALPKFGERFSERAWHEWAPTKRHKLPEYVPDVRAGSPSPLQLTEWKIGALKLQYLLELNGHLTRADFRIAGIDHRRWLAAESGWLTNELGRFVKGPRFPDFAAQHPIVFGQIKIDMADRQKTQEQAMTGTLL